MRYEYQELSKEKRKIDYSFFIGDRFFVEIPPFGRNDNISGILWEDGIGWRQRRQPIPSQKLKQLSFRAKRSEAKNLKCKHTYGEYN